MLFVARWVEGEGEEGLLGGGRVLGLVVQRAIVDYFRARRGESLLDFYDGDGGHGLLEASMSIYPQDNTRIK